MQQVPNDSYSPIYCIFGCPAVDSPPVENLSKEEEEKEVESHLPKSHESGFYCTCAVCKRVYIWYRFPDRGCISYVPQAVYREKRYKLGSVSIDFVEEQAEKDFKLRIGKNQSFLELTPDVWLLLRNMGEEWLPSACGQLLTLLLLQFDTNYRSPGHRFVLLDGDFALLHRVRSFLLPPLPKP